MEGKDKYDKKDLLKFLKDIKRVLDNAEWEEPMFTTEEKRKRVLVCFNEEKAKQLDRIIENFDRYYGGEKWENYY